MAAIDELEVNTVAMLDINANQNQINPFLGRPYKKGDFVKIFQIDKTNNQVWIYDDKQQRWNDSWIYPDNLVALPAPKPGDRVFVVFNSVRAYLPDKSRHLQYGDTVVVVKLPLELHSCLYYVTAEGHNFIPRWDVGVVIDAEDKTKKCICDIQVLMCSGCKCGGI